MDESPLDLILNSDPGVSLMPPLAWLVLALIVGLIVWGVWGEK